MKVLFCKVSCMKYYKGACPEDTPFNGGKFVDENGYGHEEFNFLPIEFDVEPTSRCMGFVETKSTNGQKSNDLHIEKINGCELMKNESAVDDVLVIWCATRQQNDTVIVGWYDHATVYRQYQEWTITFADDNEEERFYNITASSENCVLLPEGERNRYCWSVPIAKKTRSFGFGQSMLWYASEPNAQKRVEAIVQNIREYHGENWLEKYPEVN